MTSLALCPQVVFQAPQHFRSSSYGDDDGDDQGWVVGGGEFKTCLTTSPCQATDESKKEAEKKKERKKKRQPDRQRD